MHVGFKQRVVGFVKVRSIPMRRPSIEQQHHWHLKHYNGSSMKKRYEVGTATTKMLQYIFGITIARFAILLIVVIGEGQRLSHTCIPKGKVSSCLSKAVSGVS